VKILVADDEPSIRSMVKELLGAAGYHVLEASDGREAFALARKEQPVHAKNSIRPTDDMIWRGEVMDLTRLDDRRPAIGD
jgi:CheY-like chemotaxis protein